MEYDYYTLGVRALYKQEIGENEAMIRMHEDGTESEVLDREQIKFVRKVGKNVTERTAFKRLASFGYVDYTETSVQRP